MAHDVFVSYSSKDKAIADALVAALESSHIRCWYAPRDILPSEDWGEAITKAIEACEVFLIIFSANANRSQRVLDELNLAITQQAVILPFRIENLEPVGAMKLHLSSRHWLDAYEPSWESYTKKMVNSVRKNLEKRLSAEKERVVDAVSIKPKISQSVRKAQAASPQPVPFKKYITYAAGGLALLAVVLLILLAIPNSPLRPLVAVGPTLTPQTIIEERVVVDTPEPATAPTPTTAPLPYKWTRVNALSFLERDYVLSLAIHPFDADTIYAGTRSSGVYRSSDGGVSWQPINSGISGGMICQILIDPQQPENVYVFSPFEQPEVYKSQDGGNSWHRLDTSKFRVYQMTYSYFEPCKLRLIMHPADPSYLLYNNNDTIAESHDQGETWTRLYPLPDNPILAAIDPQTDKIIIAKAVDHDLTNIYLSDEAHSSWELVHNETTIHQALSHFLEYDPIHSKFILAINDQEGLQSSDGGRTWQKSRGSNNLAISTEGTYMSAGGAGHWFNLLDENLNPISKKSISNTRSDPLSIAVAPSNSRRIVTGGTAGLGGASIWISDDGGATWSKRVNGLGTVEASFGFDPQSKLIYVGQYSEDCFIVNNQCVKRFSNFYAYDLADNSYSQVAKAPCGSSPTQPWEQAVCASQKRVKDPNDPQKIFRADSDGVYLSTDGGITWDAINDGLMDTHVVYDLAFDPDNPQDLYALTPFGIFRLDKK